MPHAYHLHQAPQQKERLMIAHSCRMLLWIGILLGTLSTLTFAATTSPGLDGIFGTADDRPIFMLNTANSKEMVVQGMGMKMGDKMECKDGPGCRVAPAQGQVGPQSGKPDTRATPAVVDINGDSVIDF